MKVMAVGVSLSQFISVFQICHDNVLQTQPLFSSSTKSQSFMLIACLVCSDILTKLVQ